MPPWTGLLAGTVEVIAVPPQPVIDDAQRTNHNAALGLMSGPLGSFRCLARERASSPRLAPIFSNLAGRSSGSERIGREDFAPLAGREGLIDPGLCRTHRPED